MSTEFLFTTRGAKGIGTKIEIDMGRMRPEDFTPLYVSFLNAAGCTKSPDTVTMFTLYPDQYDSGIFWHESLCPDGMRITCVLPPESDAATLKFVQTRLRARFDVVSMKTLRVQEWVKIPKNYPH